MNDPNHYPGGWDLARVREVIAFHDSQTEEELAAEIEYAPEGCTMMAVPFELAAEVRARIDHYRRDQS